MEPQVIYIMRGIPGSGKSTYANCITEDNDDVVIASADDFFMNEQGEYIYNVDAIGKAHMFALCKAEHALYHGKSVIVDSTNIEVWEVDRWIVLAKEYKTDIRICEMNSEFQNIHGVTKEKVARLKSRYRSFIDFVPPIGYTAPIIVNTPSETSIYYTKKEI